MANNRKLFEEVAEPTKTSAPQPGLIDAKHRGARRGIRLWLMALFALVVIMIAVGGLTRLTDSGLSITEWRPVTGAFPPTTSEMWAAEFEKYKLIPEFQLQNSTMTLEEFKVIYWWEWGHRQLGRFIGLVWAVGVLGFLAARQIPTGWTGRLLILGALGGLQGAIGWWMVSSGLTGTALDVASYRLATHLGLAFVILGFIAWYVMLLSRREADLLQARRAGERRLFGMATGLLHFAFLQILLGALVAGIDAGRNYVDWPLMAGGFLPPEPLALEPLWRNFFENDGLVQFIHRITAYLLLVYGIVVWRRARSSGNTATRRAFDWVLVMLFGQAVIGIVTVMNSSPLTLALLHQFGAVVVWVLILRARLLARYPLSQSVRGATA